MSTAERPLVKKSSWVEHKLKPDGSLKRYECSLVYQHNELRVVSFTMSTGGTVYRTPISIPAGTVSYGYFWLRRPYNIYRMKFKGQLIAHRFDAIGDLRFTNNSVHYRDLILDWWLTPEGDLIEEDREELENLLESKLFSDADAAKAEYAGKIISNNKRRILRELKVIEKIANLE